MSQNLGTPNYWLLVQTLRRLWFRDLLSQVTCTSQTRTHTILALPIYAVPSELYYECANPFFIWCSEFLFRHIKFKPNIWTSFQQIFNQSLKLHFQLCFQFLPITYCVFVCFFLLYTILLNTTCILQHTCQFKNVHLNIFRSAVWSTAGILKRQGLYPVQI